MSISLIDFSPENPLLIGGPCAAETEAQVLVTAKHIYRCVHAFRASAVKPRRQPGGFEGVGIETGGYWLGRVAKEFGLPVSTEVFCGKHVDQLVDLVVKPYPDAQLVLWLGARMQLHVNQREIGMALRNAPDNTLLLIKNQPWGDDRHWMGILEYVIDGAKFSQEEVQKRVGLCHRGFFPYGLHNPYGWRNIPDFDMLNRLSMNLPGVRMILDPSHIAGNNREVFRVIRMALQQNKVPLSGYMIEAHVCPSEAWTDACQQLTPKQLRYVSKKLVLRKPVLECD